GPLAAGVALPARLYPLSLLSGHPGVAEEDRRGAGRGLQGVGAMRWLRPLHADDERQRILGYLVAGVGHLLSMPAVCCRSSSGSAAALASRFCLPRHGLRRAAQ